MKYRKKPVVIEAMQFDGSPLHVEPYKGTIRKANI